MQYLNVSHRVGNLIITSVYFYCIESEQCYPQLYIHVLVDLKLNIRNAVLIYSDNLDHAYVVTE